MRAQAEVDVVGGDVYVLFYAKAGEDPKGPLKYPAEVYRCSSTMVTCNFQTAQKLISGTDWKFEVRTTCMINFAYIALDNKDTSLAYIPDYLVLYMQSVLINLVLYMQSG